MQYLFEYNDSHHSPYEGFIYDTSKEAFPIKSHKHYFMEIMYMLEGIALVECERKSYMVNPGDLILFHPNTTHSVFATTRAGLKYAILKFDINRLNVTNSYSPKLRTIFQNAKRDPLAQIYLDAGLLVSLPVEKIFFRCIEELNKKEFGYDLLYRSEVCCLLIEFIRIWERNGFHPNSSQMNNSDFESINSITEYIDSHSHELLNVQELANRCHMSYSYFAKNFREQYGQSCKEYIEFVRVCKSEDYLLFTDYDLAYISSEIGFSDCSHYIKTYKKLRGITPKQFRLKHLH